ncbi:choice-of-anchor M domain-containing protein [Rothia uropygioeca]|uniref:choice-of-anchor M domain-containing protein n=1 Tax=Kocuria sp. 257 TaxID=2021970 RepID=UPI00101254F2|nr:choice-of-anchor M domain-containing protein [Kocuria sp. 257]
MRKHHKIAIQVLALALSFGPVGLGQALALPDPSDTPSARANQSVEDKALEQKLSTEEKVGHERIVIDHGHVDMGPKFVDGAWALMIHDDHNREPVWRRPSDVVLRAGDAARLPTPDDPHYDFVGVPAGQDVYVVPQTEAQGVVWPGWNTQDPEVQNRLGTGATLTFEGVEGPGRFNLYLENGNFSGPQVLWDSDKEEPQDIWVPSNTHTHANWVFTEPGTYFVTVRVHGKLSDGTEVSDTQRLQFAIGDSTDPNQVFDKAGLLGDPSPPENVDRHDEDAKNEAQALSAPVIVLVLVILVGAGVLLLWVGRGRRAKKASLNRRRHAGSVHDR